MKAVVLSLVLGSVAASAAFALSPATGASGEYSRLQASGDVAGAEALVARLRSYGPAVLEELTAERTRLVAARDAITDDDAARLAAEQRLAEFDRFLDLVGGKRYCSVSRLFWHTDLAAAQEASRKSGKPILSLRMLGKLTDELSCVNSRFFRTTLYANSEVSALLRDRFILHWESVRPVPVMTVDFGDGRRIVRTVTGNSIHYVLDAEGRPLDGLPGLYGPAAFQEWLLRAESLASECQDAGSEEARATVLAAYHQNRLQSLQSAWTNDLQAVGAISANSAAVLTPPGVVNVVQDSQTAAAPAQAVPAERAAQRAVPKRAVELRSVRMITMNRDALEAATTDEVWTRIAALHQPQAELDESNRALVVREQPLAAAAMRIAISKRDIESPMLALLFDRLQSNIALDTVRNEYQLHAQLHQWFIDGHVGPSVADLNRRVYAELFLTPDSDPWLGLVSTDVYTGLTNAGIVTNE